LVLDVVGGRAGGPASRRLIAMGALAAVPTAATGRNDWADTTPASDAVRRIGAVHYVSVHAPADRCAHRGGLLHEGQLVGDCVEYPLHGSRFRLEDGAVERGPSGYRQPVFDVRVEGGRIAVREA
jgi:nitrite reductase/ring-hydroxylating ferredoxin subunit